MLPINKKAPAFSLPDQNGKTHKLSDYLGQYVLLYFYPKDDTPGCTLEACSMRDMLPNFKKLKCKVFGISVDSVASHKDFAKKHKLTFTLLADEKKKVVEKYGAWQERSMYGKKFMGTARVSYLIDPQGKVARVYEKVKPETHSDQVLADLAELRLLAKATNKTKK